MTIQGRHFALGAELQLHGVAPYGSGVEIGPLLSRLPGKTFPTNQPSSWQPLLRRPLLKVMPGDYDAFLQELQPLLHPPQDTVSSYVEAPE